MSLSSTLLLDAAVPDILSKELHYGFKMNGNGRGSENCTLQTGRGHLSHANSRATHIMIPFDVNVFFVFFCCGHDVKLLLSLREDSVGESLNGFERLRWVSIRLHVSVPVIV